MHSLTQQGVNFKDAEYTLHMMRINVVLVIGISSHVECQISGSIKIG